jgi:hypothetical protein
MYFTGSTGFRDVRNPTTIARTRGTEQPANSTRIYDKPPARLSV